MHGGVRTRKSKSGPRLWKPLILGIFIGLVGIFVYFFPFGTWVEENYGLDLLFGLRGVRPSPSDILIVSIDKESADALNVPDDPRKWPRSLHARLVDRLSELGAAVIAFDVNFVEYHSPDEDSQFADSMRKARNIVLCDCIQIEKITVDDHQGASHGEIEVANIIKPIFPFSDSALASAPFPIPKVPRKIGQFWTFKTIAGEMPTLPIVVFQIYALQVYDDFIQLLRKVSPEAAQKLPLDKNEILKEKKVTGFIRDVRQLFQKDPMLGTRVNNALHNLELEESDKKFQMMHSLVDIYQMKNDSQYLNFYGPSRTITTVPYYQIINNPQQQNFDVKGKAVFIGLSALSPTDTKETYYTVFSQEKGIDISGVELAATAFGNMLENLPVRPLNFKVQFFILFCWGLVTGFLFRKYSLIKSVVIIVMVWSTYLVFASYHFATKALWYPIFIPLFIQTPLALFGGVLWHYFDVTKDRQNIRKALGFYIPNAIVDDLLHDVDNIRASNQIVYGICLTTDAEKYSTVSEEMDPKELGSFLNTYFETIFQPIKKYGGNISDVIGDSVMALWVSAHSDSNLKTQACHAALDIHKAIEEFNQKSGRFKLPTRIAMHAGNIFLGNIGAFDHYEYRPVGDIVNTSARIEGLNKTLYTRILASKDVINNVDDFFTREVGDFKLPGKTKLIKIYELICLKEEATKQQVNAYAMFSEGLAAFRNKSWDEAKSKFRKCNDILGHDGPSVFYLAHLQKEAVLLDKGELWEGAISIEHK